MKFTLHKAVIFPAYYDAEGFASVLTIKMIKQEYFVQIEKLEITFF
ncbi:MAG: hypothetical protein JJT94_06885 [Bernardetiaceae bacterium]|nr:hypothetical protein [Bernardetiaceae bacterium]